VKPKALKPGDTVGLITPSSYVFDTWRIDLAAARLEASLGVKCKTGRFVKSRHGYMAGTEKERLEDLHAMFADTSVAAAFCLDGGNVTLVSTTMGTPYEIDARGKILFLEDTGEAPYRVDRMLTQLKLAGKLQEAAGIVWGTCTECTPARSSFEVNLSMSDLLD